MREAIAKVDTRRTRSVNAVHGTVRIRFQACARALSKSKWAEVSLPRTNGDLSEGVEVLFGDDHVLSPRHCSRLRRTASVPRISLQFYLSPRWIGAPLRDGIDPRIVIGVSTTDFAYVWLASNLAWSGICKEEEGVEHLRVRLALTRAVVYPYHKHVSCP